MIDEYFKNCLFFSGMTFFRQVSRLADRSFLSSGLSPMDAFLLMVVAENPGISQRALGEKLGQLESSVSRAVSNLSREGQLEKSFEGKTAVVSLTAKGKASLPVIAKCWNELYETYSDMLGESQADALTSELFEAARKLQ